MFGSQVRFWLAMTASKKSREKGLRFQRGAGQPGTRWELKNKIGSKFGSVSWWGKGHLNIEARNTKFETKMSNPKLKTLNSKQTQMSKGRKSKPMVENSKLTFEFYILDLLRIWSLVFRV